MDHRVKYTARGQGIQVKSRLDFEHFSICLFICRQLNIFIYYVFVQFVYAMPNDQ